MAIAFARVSIHSRSKGHSAVAAAAYRAGQALYDERTGELHDFSKRKDVVYHNLMLPVGTEEKFADREYLWNQVEHAEKRKDSQLAKDVILALPRELMLDQQIDIARNFAYDHFVKHGLAADVAIHDHGDGNPHAHIYVTTRRLLEHSFDKYKARDLNPSFANWNGGRGFISEQDYWDQTWRKYQDLYFKKHDLDISVDANHLIPQRHQGRIRGNDTPYIKEENELKRQASIEIAVSSPAAVLNELGSKYTVFTDQHIKQILRKNTESQQQEQQAKQALLQHQDLILLGPGDDGRNRYTTSSNYQLEAELADNAEALYVNKFSSKIPLHLLNQLTSHYGLNSEQADALHHIASSNGIAAIVGRAGTGKSYMLGAARDMWQRSGFTIQGMAISGVAAGGLQAGSGIKSNTIAYYRQLIAHNAWNIDKNTVVVMDEAGMTDLHDMAVILRHVQQAGAKMILVGDHDQLQPVGPGAPFRAIVERVGLAEMNRIMRQQNELDCVATSNLSKGNIGLAIDHYHRKDQIRLVKTSDQAQQQLISEWLEKLNQTELAKQLILAHRNADVASLNILARDALVKRGRVASSSQSVITKSGEIELAVGDRLLFLRNDKAMAVHNGDFATVESIKHDNITVTLDNKQRKLIFCSKDYQDFTYGYAATVHKTQGVTLDNVFVYVAGRYWDRFLSYVALSRHRFHVSLYASREQFRNIAQLKTVLGRDAIKDSVLDWALSFAIRRGFDPESMIGRFIDNVAKVKQTIKDKWLFVSNYAAYLQLQSHKHELQTKQQQRQAATLVAEFVDLHRSVGKEWSQLRRALKSNQVTNRQLHQQASYKLLVKDAYYKNQLANDLQTNYSKYKDALLRNSIKQGVIARAAMAYHNENRILEFIEAYKSNNNIKMQFLAEPIANDIKSHYPALATHCGLEKLNVSDVIATVQTAAIKYKYLQAKRGCSTKDEQEKLDLAYKYIKLAQQLQQHHKLVQAYSAVNKLSEAQLQQYSERTQIVDELAAKLYINKIQYHDVIKLFNLDVNELKAGFKRNQQLLDTTFKDQRCNSQSFADLLNQPRQIFKSRPKSVYNKLSQQWNYDAISHALQTMGEIFYEQILGFNGKREGSHHIRYGQGHAIVYAHSGRKAGSWHSFSSGEGGGPIQLLMSQQHGLGLSYQQALQHGAQLAGLSPDNILPINHKSVTVKVIKADEKSNAAKIRSARYYYETGEPVYNTLGEYYLRTHRAITGNLDEVHFHPRIRDTRIDKTTGKSIISHHPGIVVAARNAQGEITGSQTILLDSKTSNKVAASKVGAVKRSRGVIKGSAVLIQASKSEQVILAEGVETALSICPAAPDANIYVTLGNIKNAEQLSWLAEKHNTNKLYFAADYDPHTNHSNLKAIKTIAKTFARQYGIETYVSLPIIHPETKCDFNDLLQQQSDVSVQQQLNNWQKIEVSARSKQLDNIIAKSASDIAKIDSEIEQLKSKDPTQLIKTYQQLLVRVHSKGPSYNFNKLQLDKLSIKILKDKKLLSRIKQINPQIGKVIAKRAKLVIGKEKSRDIER